MKSDSERDVLVTDKQIFVKLPTLEISDDDAAVIVASNMSNYFNQGGQRETNCCGCDKQLDD